VAKSSNPNDRVILSVGRSFPSQVLIMDERRAIAFTE
jgi:hypothetical protein